MLTEDARRLDKIDKLYALRLDQYVSLPMLVVVGDQSSGKSSVLEGLTSLPFPRDSTLCTRFPTQIVFKRSSVSRMESTIMPLLEPDESKSALLTSFALKNTSEDASIDALALVKLLSEACDCMGVPRPGQERTADQKSFSLDVLKIELSGPEHEHFSVVDLPGLFRKPTPGQTTREDIDLVRNMVSKYLMNSRSIILAVVPANIDIATQEIIQMAEDADLKRQRTLGVLTKPDLVDKGAEDKVLALVARDASDVGLGYTVVCNRGQSDLNTSLEERNHREKTFFDGPLWSDIPQTRCGIGALRSRLNDLLVYAARQHFQGVITEIDSRLEMANARLLSSGSSRATSMEQRMYLLQISSAFQSLSSKAADAYYMRDDCFRVRRDLRLATRIMSLHEQFSESMFKTGSTRKFSGAPADARGTTNSSVADSEAESPSSSLSSPSESETKASEDASGEVAHTVRQKIEENESSLLRRYPELSRILKTTVPPSNPLNVDIMEWISQNYRDTKGFEIATVNRSLVPSLFTEQAQSWKHIALRHVEKVVGCIHEFLQSMLEHVCSDKDVAARVWSKLIDTLLQRYACALSHTEFLVEVEMNGNPITVNHYFADNLKKARLSRIERRLRNVNSWISGDGDKEPLLRLTDTLNAYISNEGHTIEDLHDALKSYYKVARKRFVDAVCKQSIDYHLICGKASPLSVFSPQFVGGLSEQELCFLAGESAEAVSRRQTLAAEIQSLKEGKRILEA